MGTSKVMEHRARRSAVGLAGSGPVSPRSEERAWLLPVKPAEEFLKQWIGFEFLDCVESVAQLLMRPGLVDEIFTGVAGRRCFRSALATRNHVVPLRGHLAFAEYAAFDHTADWTSAQDYSHSRPLGHQLCLNGGMPWTCTTCPKAR